MKTVISIVLAIIIAVLVYLIYDSIMEPVRFNKEAARREARIIDRLKEIRTAQVAHRTRYGTFLGDLDSLVQFVKNDSIAILRAIGTVPDSLTEAEAVRLGIVQRDTFWMPARDTILASSRYPIDSLPYIPFGGGKKFTSAASMIERGMVKLPVFEVYTTPDEYMKDLQYLVYYTRLDGLKVGSLVEASIDGNWE